MQCPQLSQSINFAWFYFYIFYLSVTDAHCHGSSPPFVKKICFVIFAIFNPPYNAFVWFTSGYKFSPKDLYQNLFQYDKFI